VERDQDPRDIFADPRGQPEGHSKRVEAMSVVVAEDRSMCVQPHQLVRTAWVDIDLCRLGFRMPMSPEAVEKKYRRLLNIGDCAPWPPIVGHWEDGRFVVCDGRHDYLAALMMGRDKLFVCWLEAAPIPVVEQTGNTSCAPRLVDSSPTEAGVGTDPAPSACGDRLAAAFRS
jgi:hypothetical protein